MSKFICKTSVNCKNCRHIADEDKTKAIKHLYLNCVGAVAIAPRHEVRFVADKTKRVQTILNSLWTDDGLVVRNEIVENADEDKTKANKHLYLNCVGAVAIAPRHEVRFVADKTKRVQTILNSLWCG